MRNEQSILSDVFLQPWFLSQQTAFAIRKLLPAEHQHKMRAYFDDYGCLKCGEKNARYASNAMCKHCIQQVKLRMLFAVKRRWTEPSPAAQPSRTFQRAAEARRLLVDLRPKGK
jgi:hypothetical protein